MQIVSSCLMFFSRFHVELWIFTSLFLFCCQKRKYFLLRYLLATCFFIAVPYLMTPKGESLYYYSYLKIGDWVNFSWLVFYFLDMVMLFFLFRLNFKEVLFFGSSIYTMQHLLKRLVFLFCKLCGFSYRSFGYMLVCFVFLIILFFVYYFLFVRRINEGEHINSNNVLIIAISVITVFLYCFLSSYDDKYSGNNLSVRISTTMTDILILILLFGLLEQSKANEEKKNMQKLLHEKKEDMIISKKNIDIINRKTHDLKHQIDALRTMNHLDKDRRLDEIEKEIGIYDNVARTGNEVLDIILTKKSLYCQKHGISLNYNIDDSDTTFIDDVDFYTIFGNLIDNATEALLKVSDKEKRVVFLEMHKQNGFLFLKEENFYSSPIVMKDGFPVTSKPDSDYHGIGLKSIDFLVKKYHGNLKIQADDNDFIVSILIPFPKKKKEE